MYNPYDPDEEVNKFLFGKAYRPYMRHVYDDGFDFLGQMFIILFILSAVGMLLKAIFRHLFIILAIVVSIYIIRKVYLLYVLNKKEKINKK